MAAEPVENRLEPIPSVDCDVGVDEELQALVPAALWQFDRLVGFDLRRFRHCEQCGDHLLECLTDRRDHDDIAVAIDREFYVHVSVGELDGDWNGLAVAGFKCLSVDCSKERAPCFQGALFISATGHSIPWPTLQTPRAP
jgi:hypothetical protein